MKTLQQMVHNDYEFFNVRCNQLWAMLGKKCVTDGLLPAEIEWRTGHFKKYTQLSGVQAWRILKQLEELGYIEHHKSGRASVWSVKSQDAVDEIYKRFTAYSRFYNGIMDMGE